MLCFRPWEWWCYVMAHAHSQQIHRVIEPGAVAYGGSRMDPSLTGLLKCFCHQRSVACITASPALGTQRKHVTTERAPSGWGVISHSLFSSFFPPSFSLSPFPFFNNKGVLNSHQVNTLRDNVSTEDSRMTKPPPKKRAKKRAAYKVNSCCKCDLLWTC